MDKFIPLLLLTLLCSCITKSPYVNPEEAKANDRQIYEYLQRATPLTDEQKIAIMNYEPFIGMTIDEARMAMEQISEDTVINNKIYKTTFIGQWKTKYVLIFNLGSPNRVVEWTTFTYEEVKEISEPRDHRPNSAIPILK